MKKLLKSLIIFSAPIIILVLLFFMVIIGISELVVKNSNQYKYSGNIDILFLGDSHITNAVIDSLIPNSLNASKTSETYYYTFQKLKFISSKSNIKSVVLGYSYHNISAYQDFYTNGSLSYLANHSFFSLDLKEKIRVLNWNKKKLLYFLKELIKSAEYQFKNRKNSTLERSYLDGFYNEFKYSRYNYHSTEKRITYQFKSSSNKFYRFSELNLFYFYKIIKFCNNNNIELILLNTPLHQEYIKKVPNVFITKYNNIVIKKNLQLINLENIDLSDSCYVADGDHVSCKGAQILTRKLGEILKLKND